MQGLPPAVRRKRAFIAKSMRKIAACKINQAMTIIYNEEE